MLGTPFTIGRVVLRNRIGSPPMERNYCNVDGTITRRYVDYLRARARGGAALLFTEAAYVRPDGRGRQREMGVHDDYVIPGMITLADAIHAEGALLGVELNHAGRGASTAVTGLQAVAPSAVPFPLPDGQIPRSLTTAEIAEVVAAFGAAARRCVAAGVDVLEIHAAHGYLIHQFLSPRTNHRTDDYADPTRFANEVIAAVRAAAPDTPVFLRISALEGVDGGLTADATRALVADLRLDLIDVLDISAGCYKAGEWIVQPGELGHGVLAPLAARYRDIGKPLSVAGLISTGAVAEDVLRYVPADLVAVGRALHADPDWPRKTLAGQLPRPCIACNQGCIDQLHTQQPIWCVVNPAAGHENTIARPAVTGRSVLVVGGGPAGMEAARRCAEQGHRVILVEARAQLGGQFRLAASLASKRRFERLLDWYEVVPPQVGVDVRTSTRADPALIDRIAPDAVIMASGGTGIRPSVPGGSLPRVIDVRDWLGTQRQDAVATIWGADRIGLAVADEIAARGSAVLLLGARTECAPEAGIREKGLPLRRISSSPKVAVRLGVSLEAIEEDRILVGHAGNLEWIPARGPLIISRGTTPNHVDLGDYDGQVHIVGEANMAMSAASALRDGALAPWQLR